MDTNRLTGREHEVFALAASGLTNQQIAEELGISYDAVRYLLKEVHSKLDTGGDRSKLSWRRFKRLGAGFAGLGALRGALLTGTAMAGIGVASVGVFLAYPGGGAAQSANVTPGPDRLYENGCPATVHIGGATLAGVARGWHTTPAEITKLNPGLGDGPFSEMDEVNVPYDPQMTCSQAEATPAGASSATGGSPTPVATCPPTRCGTAIATPARPLAP